MISSESDNIRDVTYLVILAKAFFTAWLGIPVEQPWNLPFRVKSRD